MGSRKGLQACANCDRSLRSSEELDLDLPSDENEVLGLPANSANTDNLTSHFGSTDQTLKVTDFIVGFSDCQRSVTLYEALNSVFTFNSNDNRSGLAVDNEFGIHKNVVMCVECAEVVSSLYKSYVTLMEMSKVTGMLARVIRQAQHWHRQSGNYAEDMLTPSNYVEQTEISSHIKIEINVEDADGTSEDFDEGGGYAEFEGGANSDISNDFTEGGPFDPRSFDTLPNPDGLLSWETPPKRETLDESDLDAQFTQSSMRAQNVAVRRSARNRPVPSLIDVRQSSNLDPGARKTKASKGVPKPDSAHKVKKNKLKVVQVDTPILPLLTESQDHVPITGSDNLVGLGPFGKRGRSRKHIYEKLSCDQCNKVFLLQWKLTFHRLSVHEGKKPKECKVCRLKYYDDEVFKIHVCIPKSAQPLERRTKPLYCNYCGKFIRERGIFTRHCLSHDRVTLFPCRRGCKRSFKTKENLARHEELHNRPSTTPSSYQCSICGNTFKARRGFKEHMDRHVEPRKFLCTQCGMSFGHRNGLARHTSSVHDNVLRFKCPICDKGFKRKDKVAQHLNSKVHPKELVESFRSQGITAIKINRPSKTKSDLIPQQNHSINSSPPLALQKSETSKPEAAEGQNELNQSRTLGSSTSQIGLQDQQPISLAPDDLGQAQANPLLTQNLSHFLYSDLLSFVNNKL